MDKRLLIFVVIGILAAVFVNNNITGSAIKTFCGCESIMDPVCSTDDRSYLNNCVLDCFNLEKRHKGSCNICGDGFCDDKESQYTCHIDCKRDLCNTTEHPYGNCIGERPFYCTRDGELKVDCNRCGCPFGQYCQTENNSCAHLLGMRCKINEVEFLKCGPYRPFFCNDNDKIIERCDFCGCPKDRVCNRDYECVLSKCDDGTEIRQCAEDKPKWCFYGELIYRCDKCGCPDGLTCRRDGVCVNTTKQETI
jgi:hypothetical protein